MLRIGVPWRRITGRGEIEIAGLGDRGQIMLVTIGLGAHTIAEELEKRLSKVDDHANRVCLVVKRGYLWTSSRVSFVSCTPFSQTLIHRYQGQRMDSLTSQMY